MNDQSTEHSRNIVLFSDGTGNSASKQFKTNVWRTYRAVDLSDPNPQRRLPRQIAFYRDGVGTETFKPLAMIGGAFGFGVMRDVRSLYTYSCRNYREGDRIYAFGFSRGAFTLRLLIELISECGLAQVDDDAERKRCVTYAHNAFRRHFIIKAAGKRGMIYDKILPPPYYHETGKIRLPCPAIHPEIAFLGLWDTVEAYGMPVDELKRAIDEWVWPMTLADRTLSPIVRRAFHALSLDDERPTFSPVLWDEANETTERIQQVWFAGVHANVGGGYPIDSLAHVPLCWILKGARDAGLRLTEGAFEKFERIAEPQGVAYDSRSGVAGYYRYGPRDLNALSEDEANGVTLKKPLKIHGSVAERIAARQVRYAPVSLPDDCVLPHPVTREPLGQRPEDKQSAEAVIWWRKVVYYTIVAVSLVLVLAPVIDAIGILRDPSTPLVDMAEKWLEGSPLPIWSHHWLKAFSKHPLPSFILLFSLAWLFFKKSNELQQWSANRSEWAWGNLKRMPPSPGRQFGFGDAIAVWARRSPILNGVAYGYNRYFPSLLGFVLFATLVIAGIAAFVMVFILIFLHYYVAMGLSIVCAAVSFLKTEELRTEVAAVVHEDLGIPLVSTACLPELKWSYDQAYIERFKAVGLAHTFPNGLSVLETYHTRILVFRDVFFAISLAVFIASSGCLIGRMTGHPQVATYFYITGAVYGFADAAEDLVLSRLFAETNASNVLSQVSNILTKTKMVFICLSLIGLAAFLFFAAMASLKKKWTKSLWPPKDHPAAIVADNQVVS